MQHGGSPDSGAVTYAPQGQSWPSLRKTASSGCTGIGSSVRTARSVKRHARCRFQSWISTGRSSTTQSVYDAWLVLTRVQRVLFRQSSPDLRFFRVRYFYHEFDIETNGE